MTMRSVPLVLVSVGVLLLLVAFVLPRVVGGEATLPDEVQKKLEESGKYHEALVHRDGDGHGHSHGAEESASPEELRKEHEELVAQLEAAQNRGRGTAVVMKWLGIIMASVGVVAFLVQRE